MMLDFCSQIPVLCSVGDLIIQRRIWGHSVLPVVHVELRFRRTGQGLGAVTCRANSFGGVPTAARPPATRNCVRPHDGAEPRSHETASLWAFRRAGGGRWRRTRARDGRCNREEERRRRCDRLSAYTPLAGCPVRRRRRKGMGPRPTDI